MRIRNLWSPTSLLVVACVVGLAGQRAGANPEPQAGTPGAAPGHAPELVPQSGHSDKIRTVAWSPDGRVIASGGSDRRIKLWDAASGTLLRTLTGPKKRVESLAFSPDGRSLASTGPDSTLRVWDLDTGELVATQERQSVEAPAVAFSPDGTRVAWAVGSLVELWDPGLRTLERRLEGHASDVLSVAFGADGRTLAAGARDGSIRSWDVKTGARRAVLSNGKDPAASITFNPDATLLACASGNDVAIWDVGAARVRLRLQGHTAAVLSVAWSREGSRIASSAGDNTIRLWDRAGATLHTLRGHAGRFGWVFAASFSPDGESLASGSEDATVKLWNVRDGAERATLGGRADRVEAVAFSPDGKLVAVGGLGIDSELQVWDADGGGLARTLRPPDRGSFGSSLSPEEERFAAESLEKAMHTTDRAQFEVRSPRLNFSSGTWAHGDAMRRILAGFPGTVRSIAFSPGGERLISGSLSRVVRLWDPLTGSHVRTLTAHSGVVRAVAVSPDGLSFASGGEDGALKLWNASNFHLQMNVPRAHEGPLLSLAFSPDGRWLASGAEKDEHVKIWSVASGSAERTLAGHRGGVDAVAFARDGRSLVVAALDTEAGKNSLWLWDPASGREQRRLPLEEWPVALSFSPDGRTLAVGTYEGTVRLFGWPEAALLRTLSGHSGPVWSVAFSPSGQLLLTGGDDTTMRLWSPETGALLATAAGRGSEWLVIAPDGLFDGSPSGWGDVRWRFSRKLFDVAPAEMFFSEFYYPGLLAELLAGKRPRAPRSIGEIDRRQPLVALRNAGEAVSASRDARRVALRVEVTEAAAGGARGPGGARDVRLFRNGSLVKLWRGDVLPAGGGKAALEATLPIVAGENRFSAYAFNRDNIKSADAELRVTGDAGLARKGTAYVLAIGINRYANADYGLSYAVPDATAFAETLREQQTKLGTFGRVEVVPLLDRDATKRNILDSLSRLSGGTAAPLPPGAPAALGKLAAAEPQDAVFVYYAGHGTAVGPSFYLIPHDLGYAGKRTALDAAGLKAILAHAVSDRELEQAFEGVDAGRLVLVIDACNSGQALEAEEKRRGPMNSRGLAQLAYEKGMSVLAASQGYQAALEVQQLGHGLLTYALVEEGLKSPAADGSPKDGRVVLREWLDYATQRVPELQGEAMRQARAQGRELAFVPGEETRAKLEHRSLQRPRVFYRREPEREPFVVARTGAVP